MPSAVGCSEGLRGALRENTQHMLGSLCNRKAGHFIENIAGRYESLTQPVKIPHIDGRRRVA
jgi:hypothetical protein